jgi:hypothetical protein
MISFIPYLLPNFAFHILANLTKLYTLPYIFCENSGIREADRLNPFLSGHSLKDEA